MQINLFENIKIFIEIIDSGSFSKAAENLQLHRPAVTKALQLLEKESGVRLLQRTTRRIYLTPEGEEFYRRSKPLLAQADDLLASFAPEKPLVHLRKARTCYDHLAGDVAVRLYTFMQEKGWFTEEGTELSAVGLAGFRQIGATLNTQTRRKTVCACLDWSERRPHLGGNAGAALLAAFEHHGWIERIAGYREVRFTDAGRRALAKNFANTLS